MPNLQPRLVARAPAARSNARTQQHSLERALSQQQLVLGRNSVPAWLPVFGPLAAATRALGSSGEPLGLAFNAGSCAGMRLVLGPSWEEVRRRSSTRPKCGAFHKQRATASKKQHNSRPQRFACNPTGANGTELAPTRKRARLRLGVGPNSMHLHTQRNTRGQSAPRRKSGRPQ